MNEINVIIEKLVNNESLTQRERFTFIKSQQVKPEVLEYLANRLANITIEIVNKHKGQVLELMKKGLLEGWCWQTTDTVSIFLNDNDYIERGNLIFEEGKIYYHSWVCFRYDNTEYVFDPCLDFLCEKDVYHKIFEVEVKGGASAYEVKEELLYRIAHREPKKTSWLDTFLRLSEEEIARLENEISIKSNEDVYSPMYRNNTGYTVELEDNKIKKMVAHYYYNG